MSFFVYLRFFRRIEDGPFSLAVRTFRSWTWLWHCFGHVTSSRALSVLSDGATDEVLVPSWAELRCFGFIRQFFLGNKSRCIYLKWNSRRSLGVNTVVGDKTKWRSWRQDGASGTGGDIHTLLPMAVNPSFVAARDNPPFSVRVTEAGREKGGLGFLWPPLVSARG